MSGTDSGIAKWEKLFKDSGALVVTRPDPAKAGLLLSAVLPPEKLLETAGKLKEEGFALLAVSTAEFSEGFLVTYLFDSFKEYSRLAVRLILTDKEKPEAPSLWPVYQGAEWHEREAYDFFGVVFSGNPNLVPILLPHDHPGPPPLRKKPEALASIKALNFLGEELYASEAWGLSPEKPQAPPEKPGPAPEAPPAGGA